MTVDRSVEPSSRRCASVVAVVAAQDQDRQDLCII
ncbi:hypothetical protein Ae706Ps2_6083c [Pseudonocardia sp. Ae706_Ps2]|nr:hypothetical protein Ae706Ps2_6073c [Pseudonocardia sp. Ae706_Ps2]OLM09621.1 hypothetical protein Ae706Ps2_6083c [Pseudonocardia sp. Ae706_Ps2]